MSNPCGPLRIGSLPWPAAPPDGRMQVCVCACARVRVCACVHKDVHACAYACAYVCDTHVYACVRKDLHARVYAFAYACGVGRGEGVVSTDARRRPPQAAAWSGVALCTLRAFT